MKRCIECGCLMDDTHESDICDICLDELYDSEQGEK